jgi:hypothetical protein
MPGKHFASGIPSLSHRSKLFEQISAEATGGLRELLTYPGRVIQFSLPLPQLKYGNASFKTLWIEKSFSPGERIVSPNVFMRSQQLN